MQTLTRPRPTRNKYKKKEKQLQPQIQDFSELYQQERRFRRILQWGALGMSFFLILIMFYLFDVTAWLMNVAS